MCKGGWSKGEGGDLASEKDGNRGRKGVSEVIRGRGWVEEAMSGSLSWLLAF